ncbi:MAG: hypothetical protein IJJ61_04620 [Clostridia bacterium]|nr:hypothetical protein [Clostridia bacterium]
MMKKLISFLLALTIIAGTALPCFAAGAEPAAGAKTAETAGIPFVLIRGMNFDGLTYKKGTPEEQNTFAGVDAGELIGVIFKAIGSGLIHFSWEAFGEVVCDYCNKIMGHMACDENGNSKYDVTTDNYEKAVANYPELLDTSSADEMGILKRAIEIYGAENVYYYNYDWRLDPLMHADKINTLVNTALADSGKDKVNLVCCSMGGIETVSYLYKYGHDKINRLVFLSSTVSGTHVTTDLLSGHVTVTAKWLWIYLKQLIGKDNKALGLLVDGLYKIKLIDGLCNFVNNKFVPNLIDTVYDSFLRDTFGTMPSVWALVLPEGYNECIKYMFSGKEDKYAGLIAKTKEYQKVAAKRESLLKAAAEDGVSLCFIAGYNSSCIPVYTGGGCNGDAILEADRMLCVAKVADVGSDLGKDYKAANPELLSPDRVVDLSGVLFPDTTWAVNGARHVGCDYGSQMSDFLFTVVNHKGDVTVKTFKQYPRFMISDTGTDIRLPG